MSEMHDIMVDSAGRLFADLFGGPILKERASPHAIEKFWPALADAGLTTPAVPEALGGSGLGLADAMALVQLAGRHAVPGPLAETILASWLWSEVAGQTCADGAHTLAIADRRQPFQLTPRGDDFVLDAVVPRVPWGNSAKRLLLSGFSQIQSALVLVDPALAERNAGSNLAGEPRDTLVFKGVTVPGAQVVRATRGFGPDAVLRLGALMRAEQMVGAMDLVIERTIAYANERVQFGRPIGRFQAVQHQIASAAGQAAAAAAATALARTTLERADVFALAVAAAKARAGEAAGHVAAMAHQVHGAIGYTGEHPLQLSTRRLWAWRSEFGSELHWQTDLGQRVLAAGQDGAWPLVVSIA